MGVTFGDYMIDSGYYDPTPEQERGHVPTDKRTIERVVRALKRSKHLTTDYESDWEGLARDAIAAINGEDR